MTSPLLWNGVNRRQKKKIMIAKVDLLDADQSLGLGRGVWKGHLIIESFRKTST